MLAFACRFFVKMFEESSLFAACGLLSVDLRCVKHEVTLVKASGYDECFCIYTYYVWFLFVKSR